MTDEHPQGAEKLSAHTPSGEFAILKIYTKDVSFETPNSPIVFDAEWKPDADINLRSSVRELKPGEYEVTLSVTITVEVAGRTAFLAEVQQAGIFTIIGLTSQELASVVGAYCPAILYPYAREMVSDLVQRGGFPPFILSPVNFEALYAQHRVEPDAPASGAGA